MLKFRLLEDLHRFLLEINHTSMINEVKDLSFEPTKEMMELFIKSRKSIIPKLKSFRKSQDAKADWRKNRYARMKGIKKFHASTEGKKMHRMLARFLATRDSRSSLYKRESYEPHLMGEVSETLKALSSLNTHLYIEQEYYQNPDDQLEFDLLMDEAVPAIHRIQLGILNSQDISEQDFDLLIRIVDPVVLNEEFKGTSIDDYHIEEFPSYLKSLNEMKDHLKG
jgi:hypothetical protein